MREDSKEIKQMEKFCEQCGKEVARRALFCANCGAQIQKKKGKIWLIISGIVLVVILVAAGAGIRSYMTSDGYRCKKTLQMAEKHYEAEEYEEALDCYQEVLEIDSSNLNSYLKCADIYSMEQSYEEAFRILQDGMEKVGEGDKGALEEKLADVYLGKANSFLDEGDYEQAVEILQEGQKMTGGISSVGLADKENTIRENVVLINEKIFDMDGELEAEVIYEYDENGKLKKVIENVEENASWVEDAYGYVVYGVVYEFEDNIVKIDYSPETPNEQVKTAYEFEYREDGSVAEEEIFDFDESEELFRNFEGLIRYVPTTNLKKLNCTRLFDETAEVEFDKNGNITKYILNSVLGDKNYTYTYEYNEAGAVTEVVCRDENGDTVFHNICKYDEKVNLINVRQWIESDSRDVWYDFEYDGEGKLKRKIQSGVMGDDIYQIIFEYEYNDGGYPVQYVVRTDYEEIKIWEKGYDKLGNMLSHEVFVDAIGFGSCKIVYEYGYVGG